MASANKEMYNNIDITMLDNKWLKYFVNWYLEGAKKEEFQKWGTLSDDYNFAMENYLKRSDVQQCICEYKKRYGFYKFIR